MKQYHIVFRLEFQDGSFSCKNEDFIDAKTIGEAKDQVSTKNKHEAVKRVVFDCVVLT